MTEGDPIAGCVRWNGTAEIWTSRFQQSRRDLPFSAGCGNMVFSGHRDVSGIVRIIREGAEVDYQAFLFQSNPVI